MGERETSHRRDLHPTSSRQLLRLHRNLRYPTFALLSPSTVLSGIVFLVALTPVAFWMKNQPEDVGAFPDGFAPAAPGAVSRRENVGGPARAVFSLADSVRTPAFWLVAVSWLVAMIPLSAIALHQVPFLTDLGYSTESAALAAGAVGGMSIIGRLGFGLLSERLPIRPIYASRYVIMAAGIAALWMTDTYGSAALVVYASCFGIAAGGSFALSALLVADLFGVRALGEIFGLLGLAATIGGAAGGMGAGLLFDATGNYTIVFALSLALCLLGAVLMLLVKTPPRPPSIQIKPQLAGETSPRSTVRA